VNVLGVITARGGSKGVPRKNLAMVAGKPLIAWTAEAAMSAKSLYRVILSTDDAEIANAGRHAGVEVPFRRPSELAGDNTPTLPVLQHAVNEIEAQGDRVDAVCLLQPTNPMRGSEVIDACVSLLIEKQADSVVTMLPVPHEFNPHWVYQPTADGSMRLFTGETNPIPRRQELPAAYHREGSVYVVRRDVLMKQNSLFGTRLFGYLLNREDCVNIDTLADLRRAEELLTMRQFAAD